MSIIFAIRCSNLSISDSLKAWLPVSLLPIISKKASKNLVWNRRDNTHYLVYLYVAPIYYMLHFCWSMTWFVLLFLHIIWLFVFQCLWLTVLFLYGFFSHICLSPEVIQQHRCMNQGNFASAQYSNCRILRSSSCLPRNTSKFSTTF